MLADFFFGRLGLDLDARTHGGICDAVDDDAIGGSKAAQHDAQTLVHRPEHDRLCHDNVAGIERENDLAGLIRNDGAIGDQDGIDVAPEELNAPEDAGCEELILVIEDRASANGAGIGVDLIVDEIHVPDVRESFSSASRTRTGLFT